MDPVEEIKAILGVEEVVGSYIQLKPAAANFRGLCPFHHEKTPSFMVSPEKGIWHCFGCGEGGDIFTFVEKMEGVEFREALENLANKAGVSLQEATPRSKSAQAQKERLYKIQELATKYYQAGLLKHKTAQNYLLKQRQFNKNTIKAWRLGFAPKSQDGLSKWLRQKGVGAQELVSAGLARKKGSGLQDLFRGRVMVPFIDNQNRPIGFTGRLLEDKDFGPKYLNTPQSPLFDKSRFLFGLNLAKDSIRRKGEVVIVEGNFDVMTSYQAGVTNVVASSGTALTQVQLKTLARQAKAIKLAFDQDKAGIAATERIIPLAQATGASLYIVDTPGAKDADELINSPPAGGKDGAKLWRKAIKDSPYIMDWLLTNLIKTNDLKTAVGKKAIANRMCEAISNLQDPVEQDHYVAKLAKTIDASAESIWQKIKKPAAAVVSKTAKYQSQALAHSEDRVVEEALLAICLTFPDSRTGLDELSEDHFSSEERRQIFNSLKQLGTKTVDGNSGLPKPLLPLANYAKILLLKGEEEYRDWAALDRRIEAFSLVHRLQQLQLKHQKQTLTRAIQEAESQGDQKRREQLLKQFRDISR